MNIEQYREMVAQEALEAQQPKGDVSDVQADENTVTVSEQTVQTQDETQPTPLENTGETETTVVPESYEVNGVPVPVEELRQGYLRQQDYTKKTQELSRIKSQTEVAQKYFEAIQTDPEFAEGIARRFDLPYLTKDEMEKQELSDKYHSLLVERELDNLKLKHGDINVQEVLQVAAEKRMTSLEDAYLLTQIKNKPQETALDIEGMKEQIRQEVLRELQSNVDTSTTIGTGGASAQVQSNAPELSAAEIKVAQNMGMTIPEYAKWKYAK